MSIRNFICILLIPLFVAGCASDSTREYLAKRFGAFDASIAKVRPGMTRRELYKILPPAGKPLADISSAPRGLQIEFHPLGQLAEVLIVYRLADGSEYDSDAEERRKVREAHPDDISLKVGDSVVFPPVVSKENPRDTVLKIGRAGPPPIDPPLGWYPGAKYLKRER